MIPSECALNPRSILHYYDVFVTAPDYGTSSPTHHIQHAPRAGLLLEVGARERSGGGADERVEGGEEERRRSGERCGMVEEEGDLNGGL